VRGAFGAHAVATARSWDRLAWLVRERPVTGVVLDSDALPTEAPPKRRSGTRACFPSLATVLVADPSPIPSPSSGSVGRASAGWSCFPRTTSRGWRQALRRALRLGDRGSRDTRGERLPARRARRRRSVSRSRACSTDGTARSWRPRGAERPSRQRAPEGVRPSVGGPPPGVGEAPARRTVARRSRDARRRAYHASWSTRAARRSGGRCGTTWG
jgi:hypothetical protein